MKLRIIAAAVLLVAFASPAAGQGEQGSEYDPVWLKVENPDTLFVNYFQAGECPFTSESIETMIDGLLVRSRLKRRAGILLSNNAPNSFHLSVTTTCDADNISPHIYSIREVFLEMATVQRPRQRPGAPRVRLEVLIAHYPLNYGYFGVYDPNTEQATGQLRNAIRKSVEDALTDYLKANYDL